MQEGSTCSRSMFIVMFVVGSLLQSRWYVLAEEVCTMGVSNYTKSIWTQTTNNVSIMQSTTQRIDAGCNGFEKAFAWFGQCKTKYRRQYFVKYETKTIMVETHNVTCCHGYEMIHDDNTCTLSGCPEGTYGDNCTMNCSCPPNAYGNCDNITGQCTCRPGWHGANCTEVCAEHFYGENCTNKCNCKNNGTCDKSIGCVCTSPGWTGQFCATACSSNTYGINCNTSCSCNDKQTCSPIDGTCTCKPGWTGNDCHDECPEWMYGEGCLHNCTCNRTHSDGCTNVNGHCDCHSGYIGDCNEVCSIGYHGTDCGENCSHCSNTKYCDPVNGTCTCFGNKGDNCTEACETGMYGIECKMPCICNSSHSNGTCDPNTGECHCLEGWTGRTCDNQCDTGMYGIDCTMSCNCNSSNSNDTCDPITGECHCLEGWTGRTCINQCETWTFGVNCSRNCSCDREKATSCDRFNGSCDCINGLGGENCTIEEQKKLTFLEQYSTYIIAAAACSVGLVLFIVVICIAVRKRRTTSVEKETESSDVSEVLENPNYEAASETQLEMYAIVSKPTDKIKTNSKNETGTLMDIQSLGTIPRVTKETDEEYYNESNSLKVTVSAPTNEYNTFAEVRKLQHPESADDEEYNVLNHPHTSNTKSIQVEGYCTFAEVRKLQHTESADDEEFNVLNHPHTSNTKSIQVEGYCTFDEVKQLNKDKESAFDTNDNTLYDDSNGEVKREHNENDRASGSNVDKSTDFENETDLGEEVTDVIYENTE